MKRFIKSFSFAWNGLNQCLLKEVNFRVQLVCAVLAVSAGIYFRISVHEWLVVLLCIGFVLTMEMINTAIELLCNIVHKEYHPGIKITKDIAAGAVLLSAVVAAVCGAIIFIPKIISFSQSFI